VVRCRGRGKTVCARGARSAASGAIEELEPISVRPYASAGRSASLLEGTSGEVERREEQGVPLIVRCTVRAPLDSIVLQASLFDATECSVRRLVVAIEAGARAEHFASRQTSD
jgi:hypothetical protein